jgi:hypothetical protein
MYASKKFNKYKGLERGGETARGMFPELAVTSEFLEESVSLFAPEVVLAVVSILVAHDAVPAGVRRPLLTVSV